MELGVKYRQLRSALEREIMEKFYQLLPTAKRRIRGLIEQESATEVEQVEFDYDGWFRNVETLRHQIHSRQGNKLPPVDVIGMTVVVDANILIAFGLADEPLHTQANQILSAWKIAGEQLAAPTLFRSEIYAETHCTHITYPAVDRWGTRRDRSTGEQPISGIG
jgi:hypothetical protein